MFLIIYEIGNENLLIFWINDIIFVIVEFFIDVNYINWMVFVVMEFNFLFGMIIGNVME